MKTISLLLLSFLMLPFSALSEKKTTVEEQIKIAMLAVPEEARAGAHIYGYNARGEIITLREGTNDFICIADNPQKEGFEAVSYHKSLEPFMARGRALRKAGKSFKERGDIREAEAKSGQLKMPEHPATLNIYYGKEVTYNESENKLEGGQFRYVVYIPFATQASTGLPLKPNGAGHPWLMDPGKHNAHIMITPPSGN